MLQDATTNNTTRWLELIRADDRDQRPESIGAAMVRLARLAAAQHQAQAAEFCPTEETMCIRANGLARRSGFEPLSADEIRSLGGSVVTEDDR